MTSMPMPIEFPDSPSRPFILPELKMTKPEVIVRAMKT